MQPWLPIWVILMCQRSRCCDRVKYNIPFGNENARIVGASGARPLDCLPILSRATAGRPYGDIRILKYEWYSSGVLL
jgi:hypothetical protein